MAVQDGAPKLVQNTDALKSVYVSTYGCQMNVNDSERMYSLLEMANFTPVSSPDQASLIIINSCSVREKPVHKVFSEVGTYRKMKAKNPALKIGVGGCVGQQEKEKLMKDQPMIDFVFGTDS
ncbi:MAG: tRNA (N6-isopentenyl adenosine(37)-C2)-methylthiotransferase MiaB, partial [Pseudobdellovibrionaceae bacterium]